MGIFNRNKLQAHHASLNAHSAHQMSGSGQAQAAVQSAFAEAQAQGHLFVLKRQMFLMANRTRHMCMIKCQQMMHHILAAAQRMQVAWRQFMQARQVFLDLRAQATTIGATAEAFDRVAEDAAKEAGIQRDEAQDAFQRGNAAIEEYNKASKELLEAMDAERSKAAEMARAAQKVEVDEAGDDQSGAGRAWRAETMSSRPPKSRARL